MAIIDAAFVKARYPQVGDSPDTDTLDTAIEQAQAMAEAWCGIDFDSGAVTEYHDAVYHERVVYLNKWNIDTGETFAVYYDRGWDWSSSLDSDAYVLDSTKGILYLTTDYPSGLRAWKIVYTGGWTSANVPDDLAGAVGMLATALYSRANTGGIGVEGDVVGEGNVRQYIDLLTPDIKAALAKYRRVVR